MRSGIAVRLRRHYQEIIFFLLVTLLIAFGLQGFEHGRVNNFTDQSVQIPLIYSYADPALYAGDFFMDARESYVTWFYPLLGIASRMMPLVMTMLALYLLVIIVTIRAIYRLAEDLFPGRSVGFFAVMLWMAYFPNPGGDFVHSPFVTHSTFAIALALWAIVFALREKYLWAAVILGITVNINAMTVTFVTFMITFALMLSPQKWTWRLVLVPFIIGILALPTLWWRFSLPLAESSLDDFVSVLRYRLWYAVFPFSVSFVLWLGFLALLAIWVYSFRYGRPAQHEMVLKMVGGIIFLASVGTVFSEIIPIEFMMELQLIRSTWLINLFIMLYMANMIQRWLTSGERKYIRYAFWLLISLASARIIIEWVPVSHPTPYELYADMDTPFFDEHQTTIRVGLIVAGLAALILVRNIITSQHSRLVFRWFGTAMIFFIAPAFMASGVPPEQLKIEDAWEDTLLWIDDNTERDALFVTPPTMDGFRIVARRSHLGNWKDGTVGIFKNSWAIEWYDLMIEMGFNEDEFAFEPMTQDRLCRLVQSYDVDHAVVFNVWEISGQSIYTNEEFSIIPAPELNCSSYVALFG